MAAVIPACLPKGAPRASNYRLPRSQERGDRERSECNLLIVFRDIVVTADGRIPTPLQVLYPISLEEQ